MKIANGWLDAATRTESPNFNRGHDARELIVCHYTAGYTTASAVATFRNKAAQASAHFVVGTDGAIVQMVNCADTAWHAGYGVWRGGGRVNQRAIGIEIVNPGYHFRATDGQLLNWQRKPVADRLLQPFPGLIEAADPWVGSAPALWPLYPEVQLKAVADIIRAALRAWPSIADIVGHRDVDSVRRIKVDPGPAFPLLRMKQLLSDRADPGDVGGRRLLVNTPGSRLNIRGGPGTEFEKLDRGPLAHGTSVTELEVRGDWLRVRVGDAASGWDGWVFGAYLQPA